MGDKSGIQWTDATWNPVTGCTKVSPGCAHCYAETIANRFWSTQYRAMPVNLRPDGSSDGQRPRVFTDVQCHPERLEQPLRWRKPRRVFVNSMSDLFHEDIPDAFIDQIFAVMALARKHTFQVLTKRAERMLDYASQNRYEQRADWIQSYMDGYRDTYAHPDSAPYRWPLPNVWLGVSVENQHWADERIPLLLQTPAAVRFLSCEPLLAPIDLYKPIGSSKTCANGVDWVIIGGESGPGARPCDIAWVRSIRDQCQAASVPCFVKQLGADPYDSAQQSCDAGSCVVHDYTRLKLKDRKGGRPAEWPEDLLVREFPT